MNENGIVLKQEKKFIIRDFPEKRLLEINGIRYTYDLFESFGMDDIGTIFRIDGRDKGVVTITKIKPQKIDFLTKHPEIVKAIREAGVKDILSLWE